MKIVTSNIPKDLFAITPIAIEFFVEHYFDPVARENVDEIAVRFLSSNYDQDEDTLAYCDYDEDENENGIPTSFELIFNNRSYRDIRYKHYITTIFHELCHANQHLTGRLKIQMNEDGTHTHFWEGKEDKSPDYWHEPWEIEAYGTEICAYCHFADLYPELQLRRYRSKYNGRSNTLPITPRIKKLQQKKKS
jgi:hypothetical protein